jgi:hypothetical protein
MVHVGKVAVMQRNFRKLTHKTNLHGKVEMRARQGSSAGRAGGPIFTEFNPSPLAGGVERWLVVDSSSAPGRFSR